MGDGYGSFGPDSEVGMVNISLELLEQRERSHGTHHCLECLVCLFTYKLLIL